MTRQEWIATAYEDGGEKKWGNLLQELLRILWDIFDACRDDNDPKRNLERLQEIENYFLEIDCERMPTLYSSALLRYTHMAASALKCRNDFLVRAVAASKKRGEDYAAIFVGLLK